MAAAANTGSRSQGWRSSNSPDPCTPLRAGFGGHVSPGHAGKGPPDVGCPGRAAAPRSGDGKPTPTPPAPPKEAAGAASLLGIVCHLHLGGGCDGGVRVACRRVVRVQLAVGGAHHLGRGERQRGGTRPSPHPRPPAPQQPREVARPPPDLPGTGPSPRQRCSASALSAPEQPHHTEGFGPAGFAGRVPAPGNPCNNPPGEGLAGSQPHRARQTRPLKAVCSKETLPWPSSWTRLLLPSPKPQHQWDSAQRPPQGAPASLEVSLGSRPLTRAAGPCAVPWLGGDPGYQSKDRVSRGNWDLPEPPPSPVPAAPRQSRELPGLRRPRERQAARPRTQSHRGAAIQQPQCPAGTATSSYSPPKGARRPRRVTKTPLQCRAQAGAKGRCAEWEQGAAAAAGRGRGTGGAGQSTSLPHALPRPRDGSAGSQAQARDRAAAEIHRGAARKEQQRRDGGRAGGSSAGPARDAHPGLPRRPTSGRGQAAAGAASTGPAAREQGRGGETRPRTAQREGGEAGLEAVAPVEEEQGNPHSGSGSTVWHRGAEPDDRPAARATAWHGASASPPSGSTKGAQQRATSITAHGHGTARRAGLMARLCGQVAWRRSALVPPVPAPALGAWLHVPGRTPRACRLPGELPRAPRQAAHRPEDPTPPSPRAAARDRQEEQNEKKQKKRGRTGKRRERWRAGAGRRVAKGVEKIRHAKAKPWPEQLEFVVAEGTRAALSQQLPALSLRWHRRSASPLPRPHVHARPATQPGSAPRRLGQQCRSLPGEMPPGRGDATGRSPASAATRGQRGVSAGRLRGSELCCSSRAPRLTPRPEPCPGEHGTAPLHPRAGSGSVAVPAALGKGPCNMAFLGCWRQRAELTGSKFPERARGAWKSSPSPWGSAAQPPASESQGARPGAATGPTRGWGRTGCCPLGPSPFAGALLPVDVHFTVKRVRLVVPPPPFPHQGGTGHGAAGGRAAQPLSPRQGAARTALPGSLPRAAPGSAPPGLLVPRPKPASGSSSGPHAAKLPLEAPWGPGSPSFVPCPHPTDKSSTVNRAASFSHGDAALGTLSLAQGGSACAVPTPASAKPCSLPAEAQAWRSPAMLQPPTAASPRSCRAAWPQGRCPGPPASHRPRPAGRKSSRRQCWGKKDAPGPAPGPAPVQRPCWALWGSRPGCAWPRCRAPPGRCRRSPGVWCVAVLCLCSGAAPAPRCASCRWGWAGDTTRTTSATAQQPCQPPRAPRSNLRPQTQNTTGSGPDPSPCPHPTLGAWLQPALEGAQGRKRGANSTAWLGSGSLRFLSQL